MKNRGEIEIWRVVCKSEAFCPTDKCAKYDTCECSSQGDEKSILKNISLFSRRVTFDILKTLKFKIAGGNCSS